MRYRPFGTQGRSSSAVGLALKPGCTGQAAFQLVCAALESGVNLFSFAAGDEASAEALRRAIGSVGRRVLILVLRLDLQQPGLEAQTRAALAATGAGALDVVMLDRPPPGELTPARLAELETLRAGRLATRLALACEAEAAQPHLATGAFDILALRYNIASGWMERNVLKSAAQHGLTLFGYGPNIGETEPSGPPLVRGLSKFFRKDRVTRTDAYRFLRETPDWSAEQITLAFALTEPGLASVFVEVDSPKALEALTWVVEREMPSGVAAQIEMARFSAGAQQGAA